MKRCDYTTKEHDVSMHCTRAADHPGPCAVVIEELAPTECDRYECDRGLGAFVLVLLLAAGLTLGLAAFKLVEAWT